MGRQTTIGPATIGPAAIVSPLPPSSARCRHRPSDGGRPTKAFGGQIVLGQPVHRLRGSLVLVRSYRAGRTGEP
jgi:hypothetical protein